MIRGGTKARALVPALALLASTACLLGATVWSEAQRKARPPEFPLALFAGTGPDDYVDEAACAGCHAAIAADFPRTFHAAHVKNPKLSPERRGCQSCHGPGKNHLENMEDPDKIGQFVVRYTRIKPAQSSAACLRCHGGTMHEAQWRRTAHARSDVGCITCHTIHHGKGSALLEPAKGDAADLGAGLSPTGVTTTAPVRSLKAEEPALCGKCHRREVGEFRHNFHHPVPEGRMTCSDCHELHPTKDTQRKAGPTKSACVTCHLEKAGPFKYEHEPVAGWIGDGCIECHKPHGSHNPGLLTSFSRGLCAQCHSDMTTSHYPGQTCWNSGCHEAVHGSNRDRNLLKR